MKRLGMTGKKYVYMKLDLQLRDFPLDVQQQAIAYAKMRGYEFGCSPSLKERKKYRQELDDCLHEYLQNYVQMIIDTRLKELIDNEFVLSGRA